LALGDSHERLARTAAQQGHALAASAMVAVQASFPDSETGSAVLASSANLRVELEPVFLSLPEQLEQQAAGQVLRQRKE